MVVDQEWEFVVAVGRSTILQDPHLAGRLLGGDSLIQDDDAICQVFLEAMAGQSLGPSLPRDDRGDTFGLQPLKQPVQLGPQRESIG